MKHTIFSLFALLLIGNSHCLAHSIIPAPQSYQQQKGSCIIRSGDFVDAPQDQVKKILRQINGLTGLDLKSATDGATSSIKFLSAGMRDKRDGKLATDAYEMRVTPVCVNIYADSPSGHFYGLQSLLQLMIGAKKSGQSVSIPCAVIKDAPRFGWRGYMLDESRHFSGVKEVKKSLDLMAYYKLNRFHWHLTDSTGWRIEIKKYPKLTTVGGIGNHTDPKAPAQFYTQDQIREIVAYAKERHITVIPEIDMPGHANAAVRAYPEYSGGKSKKHGEFTFHPASRATDVFLTDILKEVASLFPDAGIIHYGADEVHFGWDKWPTLPAVSKLMKEHDLKLKDVEKAFNQRFAKVINGMGYKTGGWDEISHAGLDPSKSVVFWWRHDKPQELHYSLKNGYDVVLCPRLPCYFDFVQHKSHKSGRRWKGVFNLISDTYAFPDKLELPAKFSGRILGIQACLWTETTVTQERREFMAFPRLLAFAEAAWTPSKQKDLAGFQRRLKGHLPQLKARGIGYYDPFSNSPEVER